MTVMFENEIEEEEASIRFESKFQLAAISFKLTPDDELESFRVSHLQFFFFFLLKSSQILTRSARREKKWFVFGSFKAKLRLFQLFIAT